MGRRLASVVFTLVLVIGSVCPAHASDAELLRPVAGPSLLSFGATYASAGRSCVHGGLDLAGAQGETVRAPATGEVVFAGLVPADGGGRTYAVTIEVAGGLKVTVLPLRTVSVSVGKCVDAGEPVGELAASGDDSSASPHVHLSVRAGGAYVDPEPLLASGGAPEVTPGDVPAPAPSIGESHRSEVGSSGAGRVSATGASPCAPAPAFARAPAGAPSGAPSGESAAPGLAAIQGSPADAATGSSACACEPNLVGVRDAVRSACCAAVTALRHTPAPAASRVATPWRWRLASWLTGAAPGVRAVAIACAVGALALALKAVHAALGARCRGLAQGARREVVRVRAS